MSVERTLGTMAILFDIIPTFTRPKLEEVEAGTPAFDYMLATLVFDLVRKQAYLHEALREYALHADPEVAGRFLREVEELEAYDQDYEALAPRTEELMLDAIEDTKDDHLALAKMLVRWHTPREGSEEAS